MRIERQPLDFQPEKLGAECDGCPARSDRPIPAQRPTRRTHPLLALVAERPEIDEEREGRPLVGEFGERVDATLRACGVHRGDVLATNAISCRPPRRLDNKEMKDAVARCRPRLLAELHDTPYVVPIGAAAFFAMTGKPHVMEWVGGPLGPDEEGPKGIGPKAIKEGRGKKATTRFEGPDFSRFKMLPTVANFLRERQWKKVFDHQLDRAIAFAKGKLKPWDWGEIIIDQGPAMKKALRRLIKEPRKACDVETYGTKPLYSGLLNVGFSTKDLAVSVTWDQADAETKNLCKEVAASGMIDMHNGLYDFVSMEAHGMPIGQYGHDPILGFRLIDPLLPLGLGPLAGRYLHAPRHKSIFHQLSDHPGAARFAKADWRDRARYNAQDCIITEYLVDLMLEFLNDVYNGFELYQALKDQAIQCAIPMHRVGLAVDAERFEDHNQKIRARRNYHRRKLRKAAETFKWGKHKNGRPIKGHRPWNPNAERDISWLFEHAGWHVSKFTPSGKPCWDENVIEEVIKGGASPELRLLGRRFKAYSKHKKLLSTYATAQTPKKAKGLPISGESYAIIDKRSGNEIARVMGRVHSSMNCYGAISGRYSSSEPNQQNIPAKLRTIYIADAPWSDLGNDEDDPWVFVEFDYEQFEAFTIWLLSGDDALGTLLKGDIHLTTARMLFDEPTLPKKIEIRVGKPKPKQIAEGTVFERDGKWFMVVENPKRAMSKPTRYCVHYGGSWETAHENLLPDFPNMDPALTQRLVEKIQEMHPKLMRWQRKQVQLAYKNSGVYCVLSGRFYPFYDGMVDPGVCLNFPNQSAVAYVINNAMLRIMPLLDLNLERLVMQVHDSLLFVTRKSNVAKLMAKVKPEMEREVILNGVKVSFKTAAKEGTHWGELKELKEVK